MQSSVIFKISRTSFEALLMRYPRLALNVIRLLGERLRVACDWMTDLASQPIDVRLWRALLRLAKNWASREKEESYCGSRLPTRSSRI